MYTSFFGEICHPELLTFVKMLYVIDFELLRIAFLTCSEVKSLSKRDSKMLVTWVGEKENSSNSAVILRIMSVFFCEISGLIILLSPHNFFLLLIQNRSDVTPFHH